MRATRNVAALCPNTLCVCDSESDIYQLFSEPRSVCSSADCSNVPREVELVMRAGQYRSTTTGDWLNDTRAAEERDSDSLKISARVAKIKVTKSPR